MQVSYTIHTVNIRDSAPPPPDRTPKKSKLSKAHKHNYKFSLDKPPADMPNKKAYETRRA